MNRWRLYKQLGKNILTEDTIKRIVEEGKEHPDFERETCNCLHATEPTITLEGRIVQMCILCGATLKGD